jgi:hypothetical protein
MISEMEYVELAEDPKDKVDLDEIKQLILDKLALERDILKQTTEK